MFVAKSNLVYTGTDLSCTCVDVLFKKYTWINVYHTEFRDMMIINAVLMTYNN